MCTVVSRQIRDRVNTLLVERGINYLRLGTVEVSGSRVLVNTEILNSTPEWFSLFRDKAIGGTARNKNLNELLHGDTIIFQDQGNLFEFEIYNSSNIPDTEPPETPPPFQYQQYAVGTLGRHLSDAVDSRLPGKTKPIFSSENNRNTDCWCDVDLTCLSSWNSHLGVRGQGVAITKRHVITCNHFPININSTIRFIANDNQVVERTILNRVPHPDYNGTTLYPDITVYVLSSDLPDSISPCKIMPANWASKLNNLQNGRPPCLVMDQEKKALVFDTYKFDNHAALALPQESSPRFSFNERLIGGDSSSPFSFIINGELSIFSMATYSSKGTFLPNQINSINQMISSVDSMVGISTGYTVSKNDLSGFPDV